MKSRLPRPKRGTDAIRDLYQRLLQHGATFGDASPALAECAVHLKGLGIALVEQIQFVQCSNPRDRDYGRGNPHCRGRIQLQSGLDEAGCDYRCPECERPVFPTKFGKQVTVELQVNLQMTGVENFVTSQLQMEVGAWGRVAAGVYCIDLHGSRAHVCIVDSCDSPQYLSLEMARHQPTCYIVVDPTTAAERIVDESWLTKVALADIVADPKQLRRALNELVNKGVPTHIGNLAVPVYSKTVMPLRIDDPMRNSNPRLFILQVSPESIRVNGVEVVDKRGSERHEIFRKLLRQYLSDLQSKLAANDFHPVSLDELGPSKDDAENVRKTINRLQQDIVDQIRESTGEPIDREDVIETCGRPGPANKRHGYRLNPRTIALQANSTK